MEEALGRRYNGEKALDRPDLLLNEDLNGTCLLIEFKRPSHALNHDDYLGGRRSPDFPTGQREADVEAFTFFDVIASARRAIDWQLSVNQF